VLKNAIWERECPFQTACRHGKKTPDVLTKWIGKEKKSYQLLWVNALAFYLAKNKRGCCGISPMIMSMRSSVNPGHNFVSSGPKVVQNEI